MSITESTGLASGVTDGIEWKILLSPLGLGANGYARVPEGHEWHDKGYDDIPVEIHGGLTYGCREGWIGFDTAHAWDIWSDDALAEIGGENRYRMSFSRDAWDTYWTLALVIAETEKLARQVASAVSS